MLFSTTYKMIANPVDFTYKSKGSKFIAYAYPIKTENDVKYHLKALKSQYPDATHHCYARIIGYDGQNIKCNDDGEPANTAGKPILRQIQKLELSNTLVVVVRYFGGTLLGVPGLIESYGNAAFECLNKAEILIFQIYEVYKIECPFGFENDIYKIVKQFQAEMSVINQSGCFSAQIRIPLHIVDAFKGQIKQLYRISIEYLGLE